MEDGFDKLLEVWAGKIALWSGAVASATLAWKKGIKPMFMYAKHAQQVLSKLDTIAKELTPNGGGSLRDVVNRIEARQVIADKRSKAFLLEFDQGIWESDVMGRCIWWNRTYEQMLGCEPVGNNWLNAVAPEQRESIYQSWEHSISQQREFYEPITFLHRDGTRINAIVKAYPLINEDIGGLVHGWYGIATKSTRQT